MMSYNMCWHVYATDSVVWSYMVYYKYQFIVTDEQTTYTSYRLCNTAQCEWCNIMQSGNLKQMHI